MATSGSEKRQRSVKRIACFTTLEDALLQTYVAQAGVSTSAYIVSRSLDFPLPRAARRPTSNHEDVARLLAELGQLATAFRSAADAGALADVRALETAVSDFAEYRLLLLRALGRKP